MKSSVRFLWVALLAALGAVSCDSSNRVVEPEAQAVVGRSADIVGSGFTLVEGQINFKRTTASAWIGRKGGQVIIEGDSVNGRRTMHVLLVPEGAVTRNTLFTMTIASQHFIKVSLRAQVEQKTRGQIELVDVGHKGFREPVLLGLDRSIASNVPAGANLTVLYLPEDGRPVEKVPSYIFTGYEQWVVGYLSHFSKYALAMN